MRQKNYLFNEIITLISEVYDSKDKYGNPVKREIPTKLFCNERGISRQEFYSAGNIGYKLSYNIIVNDFEYNNQSKAIYKDKPYSIIKSYPLANGAIELTLAERIGNDESKDIL